MATDGNGRYCWLDPYEGARLAVAEACRNVVAAGATPLGATNCLNFGNPERPEIMGQLVAAIRGMGEACRALERADHRRQRLALQRDRRQGHLPDAGHRRGGPARGRRRTTLTSWFKDEGDVVFLLGDTRDDLGGSEFLKVIHGRVAGRPPRLDLAGGEGAPRRRARGGGGAASCARPTT